jgi:iron(III) transport system permease protein
VAGLAGTGAGLQQAMRPTLAPRIRLSSILFTLVLAIVAFFVLYPIWLLFINSFQVGQFGLATHWGLANWHAALTEPATRRAITNTVTLTLVRQTIALVVGVLLAWVIARTNVPGRYWLEFGFWVALFLPTLPLLLGWILLLDGHQGLLFVLLSKVPYLDKIPPFEIFSWWGIVLVHLLGTGIPVKVFLLSPAFRNMDSALEEASRTCGVSVKATLFKIVVPIMAPAILVSMVLGTIRSLQAFEIELILGSPAKINVISTLIYRYIYQSPPEYGSATALAMIMVIVLVPFIITQQWLTGRRSHATVSGKYTSRLHDLGPWKWPIFAAILTLLLTITVVPSALLLMSTFMKIFGFWNLPNPWTINNWAKIVNDRRLIGAFWNTLYLGFGASFVSMAVFTLLAYISARTKLRGKGLLDFLTWLPSTIPGIIIGLGFLWLFLGTSAFRPLYGTIWVLIIVATLGSMTVGVQIIKTNMLQLGAELEEASWAIGGSWIYTFRRVVLPLVAPSVAVIGLQVFASSVSAVSIVALLGSPTNQPLSLLQLNYLNAGSFQPATVVGVLILLLTTAAAVAARIVGLRVGLGRS